MLIYFAITSANTLNVFLKEFLGQDFRLAIFVI